MSTNDISVRPAKQQILIGDTNIVHYGTSPSDSPNRLTYNQNAPWQLSLGWTMSNFSITAPPPPPSIIEAISSKVRIPNKTDEPMSLRKNEHFAMSVSPQNSPVTVLTVTYNYPSRLLLLQNSILTPSLLIPTIYFLSRTKPSFVL